MKIVQSMDQPVNVATWRRDEEFEQYTEFHEDTQEDAIVITAEGQKIGYVNRGLLPTFHDWINTDRIANAWVEKINGTPGRPMAYIYVKVSVNHQLKKE